ncbi:MAG TPA: aminoacyl-tRNA hydrolase [Rhizobiaceae bacterium]|nr:aminoacyl-tRNA hydrolase [Rhizobiaceae bacterium]
MHILTGLGNPGPEHAGQRHNIGFMAADAIARRHGFSPWTKKFQALVAEGRLGGDKVLLVKPQTWMNLSGQAVGEAMRFYKLGPDSLAVFYDELDLAPGKVRVKRGGGSGGHNGIKSLDAHCGVDYRRVRLGIGHPGDKARVLGYVLGDFAKAEHDWLDPLLDAVADNAGLLVEGDEALFMNRIALATQPTRNDHPEAPDAAKTESATGPAKGQSHIRQARKEKPKVAPSGPMAQMLKKLLGGG